MLLAQHDKDGKECPVYYISHTLLDYETRYSMIERKCLALVFATKKLRHYLLNAEVHIMVNFDPLKHLFSKTNLSRCLAKWVMMLTEFDLKFVSQRAIKGQALIDHLVEAPSPFSFPNPESFLDDFILCIEKDETWELYFDGSRCCIGSRVGVVLISPTKKSIPLSYHLNFLCTNNITEYEALIVGMKEALALNIKHIHIYGDSQLIIRQVIGMYQEKQDKLSQYNDLAISLLQKFDSYTMELVS